MFRVTLLRLSVNSDEGRYYVETRPDLLESGCGQEFVSEIRRNSVLLVTLKTEFLNRDDRREMGGMLKLNADTGVLTPDDSLQHVAPEKRRRTKVTVQWAQVGGRPERMSAMSADSVTICSLDAPQPCWDAFNRALAYAKEDFASQLTDPDAYVPVGYVTQPYEDSGFFELVSAPPAPIDPRVTDKIRLVEQSLLQAMADEARAGSVCSFGWEYMTSQQRETVRGIQEMASDNVYVYVYADISRTCYDDMSEACLTYAQAREAAIQSYDREDLEVRIDPDPTTVDPGPTTVDPGPTTVDPGPTTVDPNPTTVDPNPTTGDPGPTTGDPAVPGRRSGGGCSTGSGGSTLASLLALAVWSVSRRRREGCRPASSLGPLIDERHRAA